MGTLTYTDVLTVLDCGECHISFAMPKNLYTRAVRTGEYFYCPNGHRIHYYETENAKLLKEKARLQELVEAERGRVEYWRAEQARTEKRRQVTKGQLTKTKNRIAKGVCPCCNRSFVNVAKHMETQHPAYADTC